MKRIGFTLAEILVTLAIIGVIAALTLPPLAISTQRQKLANALSVAVSDFENAVSVVMMQDNVGTVSETFEGLVAERSMANGMLSNVIEEGFLNKYGRVLNITDYDNALGGAEDIYDDVGGVFALDSSELDDGGLLHDNVVFYGKKGIIYFINIPDFDDERNQQIFTEAQAIQSGINLVQRAAEVIIDVNGIKAPNTYGRDIFAFLLGEDGKLYPYGSPDVDFYLSDGTAARNWNNPESPFACIDGNIEGNGEGCTARLIDNDYEMNY